jgi:ribose 5-phosphate isomerase A
MRFCRTGFFLLYCKQRDLKKEPESVSINLTPHNIPQDSWKHEAGTAAAQLIEEGMVVGLGSGSTAAYFIYALAQRLQSGLSIVGAVPSSTATAELAANLGIPLTDLDIHPVLDIDIDGADEIDPQLNLIKGGGGALLREKVVAYASRRFVVIADETKLVPQLGQRMPLPVEVIPFAETPVRLRLEALGASVQTRLLDGAPYHTDNGNVILDCSFPGGIIDPFDLEAQIRSIVGVVATGLFLGITEQAIIGGPNGVRSLGLS